MASVGMPWALSNPSECSRFLDALVPNICLEVLVPDQDCEGQTFPQLPHVELFQGLFAELCGGCAPPVAGPSRYQPPGRAGMSEYTIVLKTYLPESLSDATKHRLLTSLLEFGQTTRQQEVLAAVGGFAFRFRFEVHPRGQELTELTPQQKVA